MNINLGTLQPIVALVAGILILVMPRLLNYIVAIYLIAIGIPGWFADEQLSRLNLPAKRAKKPSPHCTMGEVGSWRSGSTRSVTARPRARRACATCSAARAPTLPRWPISACRCRPASPSRPRSARRFYANDKTYPDGLKAEVDAALAAIGKLTGKTFGDAADPLLVSVRSGARASMPGMMDTVLNLGLNDVTVEALAKNSR